jgi:hypothetical protein
MWVPSRPPWEPACSSYILAPLLVACPPCIGVLHNSSDHHHISNTSLSYYSQDYPAVKLSYSGWKVFEIDKDENTTHLVGDHTNNRYIPSPARWFLSPPTTTPRTSPAPDQPPAPSSSVKMMVHNKSIVWHWLKEVSTRIPRSTRISIYLSSGPAWGGLQQQHQLRTSSSFPPYMYELSML